MFELAVFYFTVGCLVSITRNYAAAFTHIEEQYKLFVGFILWLFIVALWPAWLLAEILEDWN